MIVHCDGCPRQYNLPGGRFGKDKRTWPTCPNCGRRLRPERDFKGKSVRTISGGLPSLGKRR